VSQVPRPVLGVPSIEERLKAIVFDVCKQYQGEILEMEVMPDHFHLLVECGPQRFLVCGW
jgi:putative transposase